MAIRHKWRKRIEVLEEATRGLRLTESEIIRKRVLDGLSIEQLEGYLDLLDDESRLNRELNPAENEIVRAVDTAFELEYQKAGIDIRLVPKFFRERP